MKITPSLLYDHFQCPHRPWRDAHGPREEMGDAGDEFMRMLWERGLRHEESVLEGLEFLDLSRGSEEDRLAATAAATARREPVIYQGVISAGEYLGIPDLLVLDAAEGYVPHDIKSGSATSPGRERVKKEWAVQLALYAEVIRQLSIGSGRRGVLIDTTGERVPVELDAEYDSAGRTIREIFYAAAESVRRLIEGTDRNDPAISPACRNCPWQRSCRSWCERTEDLTLVFSVGRRDRDTLRDELGIASIPDLLERGADDLIAYKREDKTRLPGIGTSGIVKLFRRAELLRTGGEPVMHERFEFPVVETELFFDIESDPTRDLVYLHGFWVREGGEGRFVHFLAAGTEPADEEGAFAAAFEFIRSFDPERMTLYFYSPYEKTAYRRLQAKHPAVASAAEVEAVFAHPNAIDLYTDVVAKKTDWPLGSYGIKSIAGHIGFRWRDDSPSGALSIKWYNEFVEGGDAALLERILIYNEDDCRATAAVKDYLDTRMSEL